MRNVVIAGLFVLIAGGANAADAEYEITLYFKPGGTGANTLKKSVELDDDGTLTIEENGETSNRYEKRAATEIDINEIMLLFQDQLYELDDALTASADVPYPHIEVELEFESGALEVEVTRIYPSGALPDTVLMFQSFFFDDMFE